LRMLLAGAVMQAFAFCFFDRRPSKL